jgi:hypothetical protein
MPDTCIKRRMLFACRQTYAAQTPATGTPVGWQQAPESISGGEGEIDHALIGRIPEGIVLAFRGTLAQFGSGDAAFERSARDWINNVDFLSRDNPLYPGRVHAGFAGSVERLWPRIKAAILRQIRPGAKNTLFVTGHSKGGALANLAAWRALGIPGLDPPIRVFTIAAARGGNEDFRTAFHAHGGIRCLRYENLVDVVPLVPVGADTPRWARMLIDSAWPGHHENNYFGVGARVPAEPGWLAVLDVWRYYFGGFAWRKLKVDYGQLLVAAHSINPGSDYDKLVCTGEAGCTHL